MHPQLAAPSVIMLLGVVEPTLLAYPAEALAFDPFPNSWVR